MHESSQDVPLLCWHSMKPTLAWTAYSDTSDLRCPAASVLPGEQQSLVTHSYSPKLTHLLYKHYVERQWTTYLLLLLFFTYISSINCLVDAQWQSVNVLCYEVQQKAADVPHVSETWICRDIKAVLTHFSTCYNSFITKWSTHSYWRNMRIKYKWKC